MGFLEWLDTVVGRIRDSQSLHTKAGSLLQGLTPETMEKNGNGHPTLLLEKGLRFPIEKRTQNTTIAGVDSGFVSQSFYALDFMLLRPAGVVFSYTNGKVTQTKYFPETFGLPEPLVHTEGLEKEEFHKFVSLKRLQSEANTARELIETHSPYACFIDGSLIPLPADKPAKDSPIANEYTKTKEAFVRLYEAAKKKNCVLIGAIEDSRSDRLKEIVNEHVMRQNGLHIDGFEHLKDAPLLEHVLRAGERSIAFPYAKDCAQHMILQDFPSPWAKQLHACYIKPSQWDYPLRIEFFGDAKTIASFANEAAAIAMAQSSLHKEYAFPSVLIEADLRAGLKPEEISLVSDKIFSKVGRNTIHLRRRDRRPF